MEYDKDTSKILHEGLIIRDGIKGEFWGVVKADLLNRITEMNTLSLLDFSKPTEQLMLEAMTRANTVKTIFDWINEIEGKAQQYENNKPSVERPKDELIKIYDQN